MVRPGRYFNWEVRMELERELRERQQDERNRIIAVCYVEDKLLRED